MRPSCGLLRFIAVYSHCIDDGDYHVIGSRYQQETSPQISESTENTAAALIEKRQATMLRQTLMNAKRWPEPRTLQGAEIPHNVIQHDSWHKKTTSKWTQLMTSEGTFNRYGR